MTIKKIKEYGAYTLIAVVIGLVVYGVIWGIFSMKRSWNYSWGYESKVQETVCSMVKPEFLIKPEDC